MTVSRCVGFSCLVGLACVAACSKPSTEAAIVPDGGPGQPGATLSSPQPTASAPVAPGTMASAAPAVTEEALPTERHAERKAALEITPSNYKAELSKLAKEIGTP